MTAVLRSVDDALDDHDILAWLEDTFEQDPERGPDTRVKAALRAALVEPARSVLGRPGKALRGQLITLCYRAAGGRGRPRLLYAHIVEALHAGSLVIDDVEDDSPVRRGQPALHRKIGTPLAINTGNWLYFWAFELVRGLGLEPARELSLYRQLSHTLELAHRGQALDLSSVVVATSQADVERLHRVTAELKTGALMAFAARLGAVAADAAPARSDALARFGGELGTLLQRYDDLGGVLSEARAEKGLEDLRLSRVSYVWAALARELDVRTYARLVEALRCARSTADLARLRVSLAQHVRDTRVLGALREEAADAFARFATDAALSRESYAGFAEVIAQMEASYV